MWHLAEICLDLRVLENDAPRKELCPHLLIKTATIIAPKLPLLNYIVIVTQGSAVLLKVANWKQKCTYSHFERQKFLVRRWSWWRIGCGWLGPTPMIPLNLKFVKELVVKSPKLLFAFADIHHTPCIYLVTLRPTQLTQASFLQKIKCCKMLFWYF